MNVSARRWSAKTVLIIGWKGAAISLRRNEARVKSLAFSIFSEASNEALIIGRKSKGKILRILDRLCLFRLEVAKVVAARDTRVISTPKAFGLA
jgi:hypothetical protein